MCIKIYIGKGNGTGLANSGRVAIKVRTLLLMIVVGLTMALLWWYALPLQHVSFSRSEDPAAFDFIEITAKVTNSRAANPFTDASVRGIFKTGKRQWEVEGFCDAEDGSVYRIRFMPPSAGDYSYSVEYRQGLTSTKSRVSFM